MNDDDLRADLAALEIANSRAAAMSELAETYRLVRDLRRADPVHRAAVGRALERQHPDIDAGIVSLLLVAADARAEIDALLEAADAAAMP